MEKEKKRKKVVVEKEFKIISQDACNVYSAASDLYAKSHSIIPNTVNHESLHFKLNKKTVKLRITEESLGGPAVLKRYSVITKEHVDGGKRETSIDISRDEFKTILDFVLMVAKTKEMTLYQLVKQRYDFTKNDRPLVVDVCKLHKNSIFDLDRMLTPDDIKKYKIGIPLAVDSFRPYIEVEGCGKSESVPKVKDLFFEMMNPYVAYEIPKKDIITSTESIKDLIDAHNVYIKTVRKD